MQDILPLLEKVLKVTKNFVIIASDVDGEALATLAVNKLRGTINVIAVKAPGFGDRQKDNLGDIATLTGGEVISEQLGGQLDAAEISQLGRARRFIASKENSTIIEGNGEAVAIDDRVNQIRHVYEAAKSDWDREKAQERLGKLSNSVAVIKVGAATEVELKERKHRVEDALSATRAAVEEGMVPGGGVALINVIPVARRRGTRRRRGDRRGHPQPRAGRADAPHRDQRRPGRLCHRPVGQGRRDAELRLQRSDQRVRRHDRHGHRRPGNGDSRGARKRRLDRRHGPDHQLPGHREAGRERHGGPACTGLLVQHFGKHQTGRPLGGLFAWSRPQPVINVPVRCDEYAGAMTARRRAKIVATLGPASSDPHTVRELVQAGLDVARINFSHGDDASWSRAVESVRRAQRETGKPIAIMGDLQGPKIRIGSLTESTEIARGEQVDIVTGVNAVGQPVDGEALTLSCSYAALVDEVDIGDRIYLRDGELDLRVEAIDGARIVTTVRGGGLLTPRAGLHARGGGRQLRP